MATSGVVWGCDFVGGGQSGAESGERIFSRSPERGAVFQTTTSCCNFFLKCSAPSGNDASFSKVVAKIAPEYCAQHVFLDRENQFMVARTYGEPTRFRENVLMTNKPASAYGEIQKSSIGSIGELLEAGILNAPPERMNEIVSRMENHPELDVLEWLNESDGSVFEGIPKKALLFRPNMRKVRLLSERKIGIVVADYVSQI